MKNSIKGKLTVGVAALAVIGLLMHPYLSKDSYTVTITDKIVKNDKYMIYTDKGSFTMEDTIAYFRFNTSDEYGKIKRGATYKMDAYGWRVPLFSKYENIISFREVK